jgi:hypothetical protein
MSVLVTEPVQDSGYSPIEPVIALRLVDTATRLHAWSIPTPCCVHGLPLDLRCDGCDEVAPLDPLELTV